MSERAPTKAFNHSSRVLLRSISYTKLSSLISADTEHTRVAISSRAVRRQHMRLSCREATANDVPALSHVMSLTD